MNRNAGPFSQFAIVNAELIPEGFGLPRPAARSKRGKPSKLGHELAAVARADMRPATPPPCLLRFGLPGLPEEPVLDDVLAEEK